MSRRLSAVALPVLVVLAVVGYAGWLVLRDDGDPQPKAIDISATEQIYDTIEQLAAASDLVVEGTVVTIEQGRALTDPNDPTIGVRTQVVTVEVGTVVKGDPRSTVIVEQEAALLDGTPITINGVAPLVVGDRGWLFLIEGDDEQFPYTALTTADGFVPAGSERAADAEALGAR